MDLEDFLYIFEQTRRVALDSLRIFLALADNRSFDITESIMNG